MIEAEPKKRPKTSYTRFAAELPNGCWQADFTHWPLADGTDTEILTFLDDHSRYALSVTAHNPVTGPIVASVFEQTVATYGIPASTLTDNGMVFTTRFAGYKGGRNRFETALDHHHVTQKNSRPAHPRTCGKVERFQQTLKKWLTRQSAATTLSQLQEHIDAFVEEYNHQRPHRSLPRRSTPATSYQALPKDHPGTNGEHTRGRIRHDRDIRIINATTGDLLRDLTLDPTRDYQPIGTPKPNTPRT